METRTKKIKDTKARINKRNSAIAQIQGDLDEADAVAIGVGIEIGTGLVESAYAVATTVKEKVEAKLKVEEVNSISSKEKVSTKPENKSDVKMNQEVQPEKPHSEKILDSYASCKKALELKEDIENASEAYMKLQEFAKDSDNHSVFTILSELKDGKINSLLNSNTKYTEFMNGVTCNLANEAADITKNAVIKPIQELG